MAILQVGVDILGPFPTAPGQIKYLIVAVDYFTKWVEAELVASILAERIKRFYCKKTICHFGLPAEIIEAANKVILRGLRKRLEEAKGRWVEELPQVLWSYHTTPHSTTNETPFCLTFDTEAMIPIEIEEPSPRTALFRPGENEEELRVNLDLLQETWEIAHVREYAMKGRASKRHNIKLMPRKFECRDLLLRKITRAVESNKLTPV
ncbi:hypothetical protein CR513_26672, partial [Mucuna pruriens]